MENKQNKALLLVDLQNDFLSDGENYFLKKKNGDMTFVQRVVHPTLNIIAKIRNNNEQFIVIWIYSIYGDPELENLQPDYIPQKLDTPTNNEVLSNTHKQRGSNKCCPRNSEGANFYQCFYDAQIETDIIIEKHYYSAFRKTNLHQLLQEKNIQNLYICGVATHFCVKATTVDAYHLGYNCNILEQCVGSSREKDHIKAIEALQENYAQILNNDQFISLIN